MRTGKRLTFQGISVIVPNDVSIQTEYHVSYNNRDIGIYGSDTTALVVGNHERFLILNGDHRAAYAKLGDNLPSCLAYFRAHAAQVARYSDPIDGPTALELCLREMHREEAAE